MHTYQFSLRGWDGGTSDQDHLVKWVQAPSRDVVLKFIKDNDLDLEDNNPDGEPTCIDDGIPDPGPDEEDPRGFAIRRGVDCILDWDGSIIQGDIGRTNP